MSTTPATAEEVRLYQGRAVAVVRSGTEPGRITVRATARGVAPAEATIAVENLPPLPQEHLQNPIRCAALRRPFRHGLPERHGSEHLLT